MKQINIFKKILTLVLLCAAGIVNAQVHPLAFGSVTIGGTATPTNWYADYVGLRLEVDGPAAIAGIKTHTTANDGNASNTANWGGVVITPIVNVQVFMDSTIDSSGCSAFSAAAAATMNGKIAVIWRGPLSGPCDFGCKALNAQNAGAVAVVLINEYPGQGPIGMAASTTCSGITIPVFMISNQDGIAISGQYRSGAPVHMTITNWGQNYSNDLGFVPGGIAGSHNYATPRAQMTGNPYAYKGMDGAFIANYGNKPATHVRVSSTLSYTPNGGSKAQIYADSSGLLNAFPVLDSIYAMFAPADYNLPATTGTGRFDLFYQIRSDSVDQFPADDSVTYSFYATDSLYSKGRYDFTNNQPVRGIYESFNAGAEFIWGPMYYVQNAGSSLSRVQYSVAINVAAGASNVLSGQNNVYLYKWTDGYYDSATSLQYPLDSIMETGELQLVSLGIKVYNGTSDTSEALLEIANMADTNGVGLHPNLDANSWYYLAVDLPSTTAVPMFLGMDNLLDPFPRIYGRFHIGTAQYLDYSSVVQYGDETSIWANYGYGNTPSPVTATALIKSVDSFNYNNAKGLIPSVAMITGPAVNAVSNVSAKPFANVVLYPNPAVDYITVSIDLQQPAKKVTYEVIDAAARFVNKETHSNVQSEKNVMSTKNLAPGNYYMIITADDKIMSRKFTVIR